MSYKSYIRKSQMEHTLSIRIKTALKNMLDAHRVRTGSTHSETTRRALTAYIPRVKPMQEFTMSEIAAYQAEKRRELRAGRRLPKGKSK